MGAHFRPIANAIEMWCCHPAIAREGFGVAASARCATISAFRTPTIRPRVARGCVPRRMRSTLHCVTRCHIGSDCSVPSRGPTRFLRWIHRSRGARFAAIKRIVLSESLKQPGVEIFSLGG
jgi:hypothetical protein